MGAIVGDDAIDRYIRENPANWSRDRWGVVTTYSLGNLALLNREKTAFVASQGFFAADLRPRCIKRRPQATPQATPQSTPQSPTQTAPQSELSSMLTGLGLKV